MVVWRRLGCLQCMHRTWRQIVATPDTGFRVLKIYWNHLHLSGEMVIVIFLTMTSLNGCIFRVTDPLHGEVIGHRWIPSQRPVTRTFDLLFDLCLNKRMSKHSRRCWFEALSRSLGRHCNFLVQFCDLFHIFLVNERCYVIKVINEIYGWIELL